MRKIDWSRDGIFTRSVNDYEKVGEVGEGTYGVVYKARDKLTGEYVALKQVRMERERDTGMPITALREIKILESLQHQNIVCLKEVAVGNKWDEIYLVFEYVDHDMADLLDSINKPFSLSEIKCLFKQLLEAVAYMHMNWVIHRDIKMPNLLYSNKGILKLADFGLARMYNTPYESKMTPRVVTLWYRAPELLLGADAYSPAIDIWSCGCILGELLLGVPLFPGETEIDQIISIYKLLGSPNDKIWPGYSRLPNVSKFNFGVHPYNNLPSKFPDLPADGLDLLNRLLTYDPRKRITAQEALSHPFFRSLPLPKQIEIMPTFPASVRGASQRRRGARSPTAAAQTSSIAGGPSTGRYQRIGQVFGSSTSHTSSAFSHAQFIHGEHVDNKQH